MWPPLEQVQRLAARRMYRSRWPMTAVTSNSSVNSQPPPFPTSLRSQFMPAEARFCTSCYRFHLSSTKTIRRLWRGGAATSMALCSAKCSEVEHRPTFLLTTLHLLHPVRGPGASRWLQLAEANSLAGCQTQAGKGVSRSETKPEGCRAASGRSSGGAHRFSAGNPTVDPDER